MSEHRLQAIMFVDNISAAELIGVDEHRGKGLLERGHRLIRAEAEAYRGRWMQQSGHGVWVSFASAIDAFNCALSILKKSVPNESLWLRIGMDLGDVVTEDGHAYGEAVDVSELVDDLAGRQGLIITDKVHAAVVNRVPFGATELGEKRLDGISESVRLYSISSHAPRSRPRAFLNTLIARRVPHVLGTYIPVSWGLVEFAGWLVSQGRIAPQWEAALLSGLLIFAPAVILVTYNLGAKGVDQLTLLTKVWLPTNLISAAAAVWVVLQGPDDLLPYGVDADAIAVLPFVSLTSEAKDMNIGVGLADQVNHWLTKAGLKVASTTTTRILQEQGKNIREIAQILRVATVLEGSVKRQGDKLRITAQLINGRDDRHMWSEVYVRHPDDTIAIEKEVAVAVTKRVTGTAPIMEDAGRPISSQAYELFLRGIGYLRQAPTHAALSRARSLFESAIELDPNFARAHASLCRSALEQYVLDKSPTLIDRASTACATAQQLDPEAYAVLLALGDLYRYTGRYELSEEAFRAALEADPSAAWVGIGRAAAARGDPGDRDLADRAFQNAIDYRPRDWPPHMAWGEYLFYQGRISESKAAFEEVLAIAPNHARAWLFLGACRNRLGDSAGALAAVQHSLEILPSRGGYRDLGLYHYYRREFVPAADAYRKAVSLGPYDHWALGSLAHVYRFIDGKEAVSASTYSRAAELAETVLQRNPDDYLTRARLAVYRQFSGDEDGAAMAMDDALAGGSHLGEVHYYHAVILNAREQPDEALTALDAATRNGFSHDRIAHDPQFATLRKRGPFSKFISSQ